MFDLALGPPGVVDTTVDGQIRRRTQIPVKTGLRRNRLQPQRLLIWCLNSNRENHGRCVQFKY